MGKSFGELRKLMIRFIAARVFSSRPHAPHLCSREPERFLIFLGRRVSGGRGDEHSAPSWERRLIARLNGIALLRGVTPVYARDLLSGQQFVSNAMNGDQVPGRAGGVPELAADLDDALVERARGAVIAVSPHFVQKTIAAEYFARMALHQL
jgi:hypothetical protein